MDQKRPIRRVGGQNVILSFQDALAVRDIPFDRFFPSKRLFAVMFECLDEFLLLRKSLFEHANRVVVLFEGLEFLAQFGDLLVVTGKVDVEEAFGPFGLFEGVNSIG